MRNRRFIPVLVLLWSMVVILSCNTGEDMEIYDPQPHFERERPVIAAYVDTAAGFENAQFDASTGIWYQVESIGSGNYSYEMSPDFEVKYEGKFLNGQIFDTTTDKPNPTFKGNLNGVIDAWKIAFLPKTIDGEPAGGLVEKGLQKGAKIRFITPSPYGYKNQTNGVIPPNSPLIFEIEVLDLREPTGT